MYAAVTDTHSVVWYLANDPRLSMPAREAFEAAGQRGDQIVVSSITLVEMVYLVEKGRIPPERFSQLMAVLDNPSTLLIEVAVTTAIARTLSRVSASAIPDMPDRIIAATGLHLNIPIISRDGKITASELTTIW